VDLPFGYKAAWKPNLDRDDDNVEIRPLVHWYAIHKDGVSRYLIQNSYHLHKRDVSGPDFTLPNGWTKTWNNEHGEEVVQHEALPDYLFIFPFPVFPSVKEDSTNSF
jgi:hypothetical protein